MYKKCDWLITHRLQRELWRDNSFQCVTLFLLDALKPVKCVELHHVSSENHTRSFLGAGSGRGGRHGIATSQRRLALVDEHQSGRASRYVDPQKIGA